jgi:Recombination endonuclease VII
VKQCNKCGAIKSLDEFYAEKGGRDGRRPECKACTSARRKQWYRANKEREIARVTAWQRANPERVKAWRVKNRDRINKKLREIHLRNKFGLTPEQYDEMLERQGGGCAICGSPPTPAISLHVDHDHGTGEIRGLLCVRCNNGIGLFRESPDLLDLATKYILGDAAQRSDGDEWAELARERVYALRKGVA